MNRIENRCDDCGEKLDEDLVEPLCYPCSVDNNMEELLSISEWMNTYED